MAYPNHLKAQVKYLFLMLMLIASPAWADWDFVTGNSYDSKFFIDFQTLRKDGNRVKFWQLMNFSVPNNIGGQNVFSFRSREEIDCKEETARTLTITAFSEKDGEGRNLGSEGESSKWVHIAPSSTKWTILTRVCN